MAVLGSTQASNSDVLLGQAAENKAGIEDVQHRCMAAADQAESGLERAAVAIQQSAAVLRVMQANEVAVGVSKPCGNERGGQRYQKGCNMRSVNPLEVYTGHSETAVRSTSHTCQMGRGCRDILIGTARSEIYCLLLCSCCTNSKLMASTTGHEIKTFYQKTYPGEPDDNDEWLAGQYAVKFDDLKAMAGPLQTSVNKSQATPSEK